MGGSDGSAPVSLPIMILWGVVDRSRGMGSTREGGYHSDDEAVVGEGWGVAGW